MDDYIDTGDEILQIANQIIHGDRQTSYGSATSSFERIAKLWSAVIEKELTSVDVARMMILLKVSRSMGKPDKDNWVDIAGYAGLAAICEEPKPDVIIPLVVKVPFINMTASVYSPCMDNVGLTYSMHTLPDGQTYGICVRCERNVSFP